MLSAGQLVDGRFRLVSELGKGGMGVVYRALDELNGQHVALKVLQAGGTQTQDTAASGAHMRVVRFKREFRAASRLSHPHCVKALELGQAGGLWYFTLELMEASLLDYIPEHDAEVGTLALQVLAALDHIHARQIVHRDVKPQNILLGPDSADGLPFVKLSDFGVAKTTDVEEGAAIGRYVGSVRYMSPEQARNETVDPRSDLYSLGLVLYELLARASPFPVAKGSPGQLWLHAHAELQPVPLSRSAPKASPRLAEVVMRLLEKQPARRFATAAEAFHAIDAWLQAEHPSARPKLPPLERAASLASPALVGRDAELDAMSRWLGGAFDKGSRKVALLLEGEAGVGKSRLATQLIRLCREADVRLAAGTCHPDAGGVYEQLGQALHALGVDPNAPQQATGSEEVTATVDTLMRLAAAKGADELPRRQQVLPSAGLSSVAELQAFHRGISDALIRASQAQPLLVVLEDAQWANPSTLDLLGYLVRAVALARRAGETARVAFAITHRPVFSGHPLLPVLEALRELEADTKLALAPLEPAAARALVASMLMTEPEGELQRLAERLCERTQGNPLFLTQMLHVLVAGRQLTRGAEDGWALSGPAGEVPLPATFSEGVGDRAARFSAATKRVLAAASIIGSRFELRALEGALDLDSYLLLDALDEAIRAGVVEEEEPANGFQFTQNRFREAIREQLPVDEARSLHLRVALELFKRRGEEPRYADTLAWHFQQGGDLENAWVQSVRAGDHAMHGLAFSRAAQLYAQALELAKQLGMPESASLLERHGDACLSALLLKEAAGSYERRLALVTSSEERAEIRRKLSEVQHRKGNLLEAAALLEQSLKDLGFRLARSRPEMMLRVGWGLLRVRFNLRFPFTRPRQVPSAQRPLQATIARIGSTLGQLYYYSDFIRSAFYVMMAHQAAERVGPSGELAMAYALQGYFYAMIGNRELSMRYHALSLELGARAPAVDRGWASCLRANSYGALGEVDTHVEIARGVVQELENQPESAPYRIALVWGGQGHWVRGEHREAELLARKCLRLADLTDPNYRDGGLILLAMAQMITVPVRATRLFSEVMQRSKAESDQLGRFASGGFLALMLTLQGELDRAVEVGMEVSGEIAARRSRLPIYIADGAFLIAAGLLKKRDGKVSEKVEAEVARVRKTRWAFARALNYTTPFFLAGEGAWEIASGNEELGRAKLDAAVAHCERLKLTCPLQLVQAVAALATQRATTSRSQVS